MNELHRTILLELLSKPPTTDEELSSMSYKLCRANKLAPLSKSMLSEVYHELLAHGEISENTQFEKLLKIRPIRTLSGVAPVTLLTKPFPCPGKCVYCPTEPNMPKSYLSNEPAAMRAVMNKFHPREQVSARLRMYHANRHDADKVEMIVLGGTWSAYTKDYQSWFIHECYHTCNTFVPPEKEVTIPKHFRPQMPTLHEPIEERVISSEELEAIQVENEKAPYRIVGLCLETRPDWIRNDEIARMRSYGCTRVQLGIQSIYDDVLDLIKRGHRVEKSIWATKVLKDAGFKVDHHYMPNLPGSTPERDLAMFKHIFTSPDFRPDQIKIYPTIVNEYAELKAWHEDGRWKEYSPEDLMELSIQVKQLIPYYTRINRLIRDIPEESIIAGNSVTNLRQDILREMAKRGLQCNCIRCREAKGRIADPNDLKIFIDEYEASEGREYFISAENYDRTILYSFVRLRIPSQFFRNNQFGEYQLSYPHDQIPELQHAAIIRELHTYGSVVPIDETDSSSSQHQGLGKRMMNEAENVVKSLGIKKLAVISGVGVRGYYQKLGYEREGTYMVKLL